MSNKITTTSIGTGITRRPGAVSVGGALHARLRNPIAAPLDDPNTKANRIALLLDVSGSMAGAKIQALRDACQSFVTSCTWGDTALALEPFGEGNPPPNRVALTCFGPLLMTTIPMLNASGGTPMDDALTYALGSYSLTRCVLVSDGQPDSEQAAYNVAESYREAGLPCDCVHIGYSVAGEECLRRIAEMTGGQYIKFTDITSFAKSFKYLTPAYYAQLTSGSVSAAQLGAREIK